MWKAFVVILVAILFFALPRFSAPELALSLAGDPFKGSPGAKVTLVEFSDYQCPFCSQYFRQTFSQIDTEYVKSGKVKYVFRNFPLESLHPNAFKAAEAAICAGEQGKYWEMHDQLFRNQDFLAAPELPRHADAVGLDRQRFDDCLAGTKASTAIQQDMLAGQTAGVSGTPTFFMGLTNPKASQLKVIRTLSGAQPYASFKDALDGLLNRGN